MSQSLNIIETSAIDKSHELDGIVPESTYYHSTGIIQRHHAKMSPYEAGLINKGEEGASSSKGIQYNWQINATPNSVLNLNEMYFEVNGNLNVSFDKTKYTGVEANKTIKVDTDDLLIPSDLWFHSAFQNVQLRIGDAVIANTNNPIVHNVFRKLMFHGEEKNDLEGFAGSHYFKKGSTNSTLGELQGLKLKTTIGADEKYVKLSTVSTTASTLTADGANEAAGQAFSAEFTGAPFAINTYGLHQGIYNFASGSILNKTLEFNTNAQGEKKTETVPFTVIMKLSDLFDCDDLLPIFNQQVKISLQRSAYDSVSIQCAHKAFSVTLKDIQYFQLNVFQYLLDPSNSATLMNVYSKPKTVVFSTKQQVFQTVTSTDASNQVTVNSPTGLLFGAKFLMMYLAKSNMNTNLCPDLDFQDYTAGPNEYSKYLGILKAKESGNVITLYRVPIDRYHAAKFPSLYMGPHAPLNIMYNNININCDNYTVLYDDITPLKQDYKGMKNKDEISVHPANYIDITFADPNADNNTVDLKCVYYNRLYHEYCESCKHTGVCPISREEYMNCYPVIMAELSDFSRISTNSFLNIIINNYSDIVGSTEQNKKFKSPYSPDGIVRTQLNILCYGLRALELANGFARLKEIDNTVNNDMDDVISTQ